MLRPRKIDIPHSGSASAVNTARDFRHADGARRFFKLVYDEQMIAMLLMMRAVARKSRITPFNG